MRGILIIVLILILAVGLLICTDVLFHIEGVPLICICAIVVFLTTLSVYEVGRRYGKRTDSQKSHNVS